MNEGFSKSDAYARARELNLQRIHRRNDGTYAPGATDGEYVDALSREKKRLDTLNAETEDE